MRVTIQGKKVGDSSRGIAPKGVKQDKITQITFTKKGQTRFIEDPKKTTRIEIKITNSEKSSFRMFIKSVRRVVRTAQLYKIGKISIDIDEFRKISDLKDKDLGSIVAQNLIMAGYEFQDFKTKPKAGWGNVEEVLITNVKNKDTKNGINKGKIIGEMVNECRLMSNTPGGDMTPKILTAHAKRLSRNTTIKTSSLGKKEIEKLKMEAILGVAKGSPEEPRFIVMNYNGGKKGERPIVLIGKGVTFDSGGLNLKLGSGLLGMHMDMSGGAAVIATISLIARLKIKKNVIALIPSVENMVSGSSFRPGDVLKSMSGKTIEIIDTDAEGRLVLADALTYAKKYNPKVVIDVATLTGASLVALGQQASVIMSQDKNLILKLMDLGDETGDYVWPLPLWDEYEEDVKGRIADIANLATKNPRYGGAINGGMFLKQFAKELPKDCAWVHIDIAPRMTTVPSDNLSSGAAGEPVRLLAKFIEEY